MTAPMMRPVRSSSLRGQWRCSGELDALVVVADCSRHERVHERRRRAHGQGIGGPRRGARRRSPDARAAAPGREAIEHSQPDTQYAHVETDARAQGSTPRSSEARLRNASELDSDYDAHDARDNEERHADSESSDLQRSARSTEETDQGPRLDAAVPARLRAPALLRP